MPLRTEMFTLRALAAVCVLYLISPNAMPLWAWQVGAKSAVQPASSAATDDSAAAPRVLEPPAAAPISPDAAQRSEPATVMIEDSPPPAVPAARAPPAASPTAPANVTAAAPESEPTIEPARLKGIQPGVSTMAQVQAAWGQPVRVDRFERHTEHQHALEPFQKVIVAYQGQTVSALVVHLQAPLKADAAEGQLGLDEFDSVTVYDQKGAVLGRVYPERGVLFSYQPAAEEAEVAQIILEPIHAQPFALRAESRLETHWLAGLKDVDQAIKLQPNFARAHWLRAQLLSAAGRVPEALGSADEAVRLDPANLEYRLTRAKLYRDSGQTSQARREAGAVVQTASASPLVKAKALCLLADLKAAGPPRDYAGAVKDREEAILLVEPLLSDPSSRLSAAARDVLIEAHLGTAHDIAWGPWNRKEEVVPKWLREAKAIAEEDEPTEAVAARRQLRIATTALDALAGMRGEIDPSPWTELAQDAAQSAKEASDDKLYQAQIEWELGLAWYAALQVHHARGETQAALRASAKALENLTRTSATESETPAQQSMLARLYFRTGAVHAVLTGNHTQAIAWYERALPLWQSASDEPRHADIGQEGESLVSMAVSYWETGQRKKALDLTAQGAKLMQQAVSQGLLDESALVVPYGNLAQMHRRLGDLEAAGKFAQLATRSQGDVR